MGSDGSVVDTASEQAVARGPSTVHRQGLQASRVIPGEIVFEPVLGGIRVTVRTVEHQVMLGFIAAEGMIGKIHTRVAVYDNLRGLACEEFRQQCLPAPPITDPLEAAEEALSDARATLDWLKKSVSVKKSSDAAVERARAVAGFVSDANRMMCLGAGALKGMKARGEPDETSDE